MSDVVKITKEINQTQNKIEKGQSITDEFLLNNKEKRLERNRTALFLNDVELSNEQIYQLFGSKNYEKYYAAVKQLNAGRILFPLGICH